MSAVNAITGYQYQGVNQATLGRGKWATFNQWRNAGYMVRKGEKGTRIMNRLVLDEDKRVKFTGYSTVFETAQVDKLEKQEDEKGGDKGKQELPQEQENNKESKEPKPVRTKTPKPHKISKGALRKVASQMSQSYKIMHIKYHEEQWSTDGYSAINQLIQPTKKDVYVEVNEHIQLEKLVDGHDQYEANEEVIIVDDNATLTAKNVDTLKVLVNAKWYENLLGLYPEATVILTSPLTPVLFKQDGKLVAVLMPLKNDTKKVRI